MTGPGKWQSDSVKVVRAASLNSLMKTPGQQGRVTAFDFAGSGGCKTWIGMVTLPPGGKTGSHHHGRHEVAVYVVKGRSQIRWGERLEFAAEVAPGDFVYFAPYVPHQERNLDNLETVDFLVVRSDNERIVINLGVVAAEHPETSF